MPLQVVLSCKSLRTSAAGFTTSEGFRMLQMMFPVDVNMSWIGVRDYLLRVGRILQLFPASRARRHCGLRLGSFALKHVDDVAIRVHGSRWRWSEERTRRLSHLLRHVVAFLSTVNSHHLGIGRCRGEMSRRRTVLRRGHILTVFSLTMHLVL